ncbi:MAG TPA: ATP-binding protein [Verrucomicrobiae bacterium]|nr:ATP-binding protein [Verrucomicrobiae bacterium]
MKSIQMRLMAGLLGSSLLVFGIGAAVIHFATRALLFREFDATLRAKAMALAAATDVNRGVVEFDLADELLQEFSRPHSAEYFQLTDANGRTLARSASLGTNDLARLFGTMNSPRLWNLNLPDGHRGRAIGFQFAPEESGTNGPPSTAAAPNRIVTLVVARSLRDVTHTLGALTSALLLAAAVVAMGMIVIIRLVVRRGLIPLGDVADRAARIDASSLGQRFDTEPLPAELLPIGHRLNDLLARLEQSFERERRFTADAAHELRTPIAELRSLAEVALKWPEGNETTMQAFHDTLEIARKMETIATGLLTLARCEAGKQTVSRETIHIKKLVDTVWQPLVGQAGRRQLRVAFDLPSEIRLTTDRALFGLLLANLFSNAVEYTPVAGEVCIRAEQRDGLFTLSVANTVDDLGPDDLPHLFQRFWRKEASRTSSEHAGLGLALARAFAGLLGMKIRAELVLPDTLVLSLEAPATS